MASIILNKKGYQINDNLLLIIGSCLIQEA